ncbi:ZIP-like iron-zinc transporter [Rickenella mellea]|uniref:ZIP-like iron-zinc transporter n=1 Tax=Rickenella mellea TaxID=50990 RepID=A0A4Y7QF05_9AGAM|nr:ZIP-like iron-zinc transporter [Rickenella mellea]
MPTQSLQRRVLFGLFLLTCYLITVSAKSTLEKSQSQVPLSIRETAINACEPVRQLSALKEEVDATQSTLTRRVFAVLFPFESAGWNAVLGTFYISSVPNFILAVIPAEINPNTLNTMTAFATGGLLSDVFLHLVPHSFMGEHQDPGVHFLMIEEKRNVIIGLAIFIGFAAFFIMEKSLRVLGGEDGDVGHSHSHSHDSHATDSHSSTGVSTTVSANGLIKRGSEKPDATASTSAPEPRAVAKTSKLSAYLNLFGDFVHNITDGLAMAASFYSSPLIGATTTLACFAHEIPHEIADYSILVRSGFTKRQAMQSQYLTAVGAFIGTFMGIAIHNLSASAPSKMDTSLDLAAAVRQDASGLLGTTARLADLVIPFVAGGFMYIGAVAVLPTLLQESKSAKQALREFAAMAVGVACMFAVAWNE